MIGLKDVVVSQGLAESLCQRKKAKTDNVLIVPYASSSHWYTNSKEIFPGKAR